MDDQLQKFMFSAAPVRGEIVSLRNTWQEVLARRQYPAPVRDVLGEMMAACALLSANLKFDGTLIMQWGPVGSGKGQFGPMNSQHAAGIAIDSNDNVYVADHEQHRVQKFDSSGNFISMWGKAVNQTTGRDVCTQASGDTCQAGTSTSGPGGFDGDGGGGVERIMQIDLTAAEKKAFESSVAHVRELVEAMDKVIGG